MATTNNDERILKLTQCQRSRNSATATVLYHTCCVCVCVRLANFYKRKKTENWNTKRDKCYVKIYLFRRKLLFIFFISLFRTSFLRLKRVHQTPLRKSGINTLFMYTVSLSSSSDLNIFYFVCVNMRVKIMLSNVICLFLKAFNPFDSFIFIINFISTFSN